MDNFLAWTRGAAIRSSTKRKPQFSQTPIPETQCARLAARCPPVVVKRGAAVAEAAAGEKRWRVNAPKIEAIDTTGAGDAFVVAFLAARLFGADIQPALERAARPAPPLRQASAGGRRRRAFSATDNPMTSSIDLGLRLLYLSSSPHGSDQPIRRTSSVATLDERHISEAHLVPTRRAKCPFVPSSASASPFRHGGRGVKLRRAFGFGDTSDFDPFLMIDDSVAIGPGTISPAFPGIPIAASRP